MRLKALPIFFTRLLLLLCGLTLAAPSSAQQKDIADLIARAKIFTDAGDVENAISTHEEIFRLDPTQYRSAVTLAGIFGQLGRYDEEIAWANKAITLKPDLAKAHLFLGDGYAGKGDYPKAEMHYFRSQTLDPKDPMPWYELGLVSEYRKNTASAIDYYGKALKCDTTFAAACLSLGSLYFNLKDYDKADEYLSRTLILHPGDADATALKEEIGQLRKIK